MNGKTETTETVPAAIGRLFPRLEATSITGKTVTLPTDAEGDISLVIIVFLESASPMAESWSGPFEKAFTGNPRVTTYLVLVVGGEPIGESLAGRVDQEMRGGVPPEKYDQVLTYPEGLERCRRAFGIDDPTRAYSYLLDGRGVIIWMETGTATPEGLDTLVNTAHTMLGPLWQ
jgi:hypothetical protein